MAQYLRTLPAVRAQSVKVLAKAERGEASNFVFHPDAIPAVVSYVAQIISRDYEPNYSAIPSHGRWQHFDVGGISRVDQLVAEFGDQVDRVEVARRLVDLFVVSVLLDAGAGNQWTYTEPGTGNVYSRSEGLAVASLYLFKSGALSSAPENKYQVDAKALSNITIDTITTALQHGPINELSGAEGRAELLQRLGVALASSKQFFGPDGRPGNLVDYLKTQADSSNKVNVTVLWNVLMDGLGPIWPKGRTVLDGVSLGDAWNISTLSNEPIEADRIVPFHKLSQWLCYSIVVPIEKYAGIEITNKELQTGLPEYRNGGLFVDFGVLQLKPGVLKRGIEAAKALGGGESHDDDAIVPVFSAYDDVIIEWRALTVGLLDRLLPEINAYLKIDLSLPQLLEAGSWTGGREIAATKRPDTKGPPIAIQSDGTLF
ncbi:hypothetical protein V1514DRAFT_326239 [Lipomyces japonicus]|uniref:uncharacterized protein n=1 Tax=Lipomyces japonicus TaxID=56871 RepID=UPI0034CE1063